MVWLNKIIFFILEFFQEKKGQSLLEVIVAMAIFSIIGATMVTFSVGGFNALIQSGDRTIAESLAQEGIEAVRSIKEEAWNNFVFNQSSVSTSSEMWIFDGEGTDEVIDKFTRTITFEDVCRDASDNIASCPGIYTDANTKKATVSVSWEVRSGITNTVEKITYLSNWEGSDWTQTDWVGGSGQSIWSNISRYDSDDNNLYTSSAGQITLDQTFASAGSYNWPFDTAGNYTYDSGKVEVTGGNAQLISGGGGDSGGLIDGDFENTTDTSYDWTFDTAGDYTYDNGKIQVTAGVAELLQATGGSCSGTATACSSYSIEGECTGQDGCSWAGGAGGNTTNETFVSGSTGWTYGDWSQGGGDPDATGTWQASGGNGDGYVEVNLPADIKNKSVGGYWEQSFTTTADNPPSVTCEVDWKAFTVTHSKVPRELYVAVYIETASGEPVGTPILQKNFTATFDWESHSGVNAFDCTSLVTTAGTYYYKVAVWAYGDNKSTGPINVGFDNAKVSWTGVGTCSGTATACNTYSDAGSCTGQGGCSWTGGSYPTDEPDIYPTASYEALGVTSWDSFTETATKNGGEIYYQLSDDDGSTWQYWNGLSWAVATFATDYNTASVVNTNISSFDTSSEQINFKAFLESDGTQLVQLDNINIGLTPASTVWSYSAWDVGGGEVTPTGSKQSSGGNPNNYVDITVPSAGNDEVGGYWEQAFTTTADNPSASIDFDYRSIDFNGTPGIVDVRVYLDTTTGDPVNQAGTSISLTSTGSWTNSGTVDLSSLITTAGTYYVKMALWVETSGTDGPFTVGFDNIDLSWETGTYPSDQPNIFNSSSLQPALISSWTSFVETSVKNTGEIYYQLSDDDGTSWQYWNGSAWATDPDGDEGSSENDYNTATQVNSYINQFSVANKKIMFKAFLAGDGSTQIQLDDLEVTYDIAAASYYGNRFTINNTLGSGDLNGSGDKVSLRFNAQNSKTVNSIRVYLEEENGTSPVYRYGLQSDNGGEPSGTWLGSTNQGYADYQATTIGWQVASLNESVNLTQGNTYHLVIEYQSGTISNPNSINIRALEPNNFLDPYGNSANNSSNVLWSTDGGISWSFLGYQPIYVLGFSDTSYEGNPYHDFVEANISSNNHHGEQFTISGTDKTVSSVEFLVSESGNAPADDLYFSLYDVTGGYELASGVLATAAQTSTTYEWQQYVFSSPITLSSGNTYRVSLNSPLSTTKYYQVRTIYNDDNGVLNSVNYDGINSIYVYSTDNGSSWITTEQDYDISGFRFQSTIFEASGYLISSAYDTGTSSAMQAVAWDQVIPSCTPNCEVKVQIQTAPDSLGLPGIWSSTWCGPDGEDGDELDFFTNSYGEMIHVDHNNDQWIRYRVQLSGDSLSTPTLEEIRVNYK